jgi:hypothetical protein
MTRKPRSMPSARITVRIDSGLYGKMIAEEKTSGKSISEQVREALTIREFIKNKEG